jgi:hypothetical protein
MYLYSTAVRSGEASPVKVMDWALTMTQKVNQISTVPVSLWTSTMSPGMGMLAWTSVVSDLAVIEETETKLMADPGYSGLIDQAIGAHLLSPDSGDQMLMQLVHADPDMAGINAEYASTVRAMLAPGASAHGIELGVEIATRAKKISGRPTSFAVGVTGDYGSIMWVSLAENVKQVQDALEALNADEDFAKMLDKEASKAYLPHATQTISRKLA